MNRTHKSKIFREVNKDKPEEGPEIETDNNGVASILNFHKIGDEESLMRGEGKTRGKGELESLQDTKHEDGIPTQDIPNTNHSSNKTPTKKDNALAKIFNCKQKKKGNDLTSSLE